MTDVPRLDASELRRAFDRAFGEPAVVRDTEVLELLAIRAEATHYAIRLADVAALATNLELGPLPSSSPAFLGVAVYRGSIVPAFSLAALLGGARGDAPWLVMVRAPELVGLAVDAFEGYLRVPREAGPAPAERAALVEGVVQDGLLARAVLDVAAVVTAISRNSDGG